jgi:Flp pilus assembly protein TadG
MKFLMMSFLRRVLKNELGQSLVFVALGGLAFIGVAGISMDLVNAYVARQQLQASTNSAALAGAVYLSSSYFNIASATAAVTKYSSVAGNLNTASSLTNVQMLPPSFVCLATVTAMGTPCLGPGAGYNAMIVTQTADVNTWFAKIFSIPLFHMSATAYATPGGKPAPLNMVIIVDTTGSMGTVITSGSGLGSSDPACIGNTELYCAMNGVGIMLNSLPFPADAPVALFAFPNVEASTVNDDLSCSGTPNEMANTTPALGSSYGPTGTSATYQIVPFGTDYTQITKAVGVVNSSGTTTTAGCLKTPSGAPAGTYLAGAIVAAQSALVAQNVVHPVAPGQSVIVVLSDGNVNGSDQYANVDSALTMFGQTFSESASSPPADVPISGTAVTYPSGVGGCGQAVQEAQIARASSLKTSIFVVSYGSPITGSWNPNGTTISSGNMVDIINASNCPADQDGFFNTFKKTVGTSTGHGTLPNPNPPAAPPNLSYTPNISPCTTDQDIATPNTAEIVYFYSDTMGATSGVCPSVSGLGSLNKIFAAIVGELPHIPRVVPVGTT